MTFEMNYLIFSIVFLIIGVLVGYFIYSRLNKDKIDQNKDLETLKTEVEDTFTKLLNDLNKKVESLETSLLGTDAMKTYKKAEKDVQSYLRPTKSSGLFQ